jgi:hypothetical protein
MSNLKVRAVPLSFIGQDRPEQEARTGANGNNYRELVIPVGRLSDGTTTGTCNENECMECTTKVVDAVCSLAIRCKPRMRLSLSDECHGGM